MLEEMKEAAKRDRAEIERLKAELRGVQGVLETEHDGEGRVKEHDEGRVKEHGKGQWYHEDQQIGEIDGIKENFENWP